MSKKILVIGNGFDIEHGLPTQYTDFLKALRWFKKYCDDKRDLVSENRSWEHGQALYDSLKESYVNHEFYNLGINNYWTEHFLRIYNPCENATKGGIDFEGEILEVIERISNISFSQCINSDDYRNQALEDKDSDYVNWFNHLEEKLKQNILNYDNCSISEYLYDELEKFTRAFEIYCCFYVDKISNDKNSSMQKIIRARYGVFDHVLSFNYTDTYENVYGTSYVFGESLGNGQKDIPLCYIHGKAQEDQSKTNMIIGINKSSEDKEKDNDCTFLKFEKYFQRIYKRTESEYKDWINSECEVYFFGHSFGESDFDIIRDILLNDNCKNIILYHDEKLESEKIQQTKKIIGEDEFKKRVHEGKIRFEHQESLNTSPFTFEEWRRGFKTHK